MRERTECNVFRILEFLVVLHHNPEIRRTHRLAVDAGFRIHPGGAYLDTGYRAFGSNRALVPIT